MFSSQQMDFVDDLRINRMNSVNHDYFQIKDIASLTWSANDDQLEKDFFSQYKVCEI